MAEIEEVKTVGKEKEANTETDAEKKEEENVPEKIHLLIQLAGWSVEMARAVTSNADVLSQLSQASVDLRQSNEALRAMEPELPLHMETETDRFSRIKEIIGELNKTAEEEKGEGEQSKQSE